MKIFFNQPFSLYIHIPFCKKKCNYCDFYSFAGRENEIDEYVEKLAKDIKRLPDPALGGIGSIKTIYFGGGTPTLLSASNFNYLLSTFNFQLSSLQIEITTECNPGTVDLEKLKALRKLGINRLSIGAQSFNDEHLKALGRIHTAEDIYNTFKWARKAGFKNIGLDLMFALPNQTVEDWKETLRKAVKLSPEHISTYNLKIEENTPFWEMTKPKTQNPNESTNLLIPNEETELEMYEFAIEYLTTNGYKHYEISNFSKPGKECQHNLTYWRNEEYIGIGDGAKSFDPTHLESNKFILGLRLIEGVDLSKDEIKKYENEINEICELGLAELKNSNLKLTRKGIYLANEVFERFV